MKSLNKSNGIIFGSTGIIGSKISLELAKLDASLILHGKSLKKLTDLDNKLKKINKIATLLQADVTDTEFSKNLLNIVYSRFKKIDFIINLIGIFPGLRPLTHFSHKEWDDLIEINLSSCWRIIKELEPLIRKSTSSKIIILSNKSISSAKAYYNTFSICQNAQKAMLKVFKEENSKLNVKTHILEIEKINFGMSESLAGNKKFEDELLKKVVKQVIKKCL